ncbi:MAG: ATP-binding protein [Bacillaceae bacterium]|nr:ATP-binding protein [Bacillaceae bacterium]
MRDFDVLRDLVIGTVDFVSPNEIKVLLDMKAPHNTSMNPGLPTPFPKINSYVLIPNELGAIVGLISWVATENSPFPKRKGFKDFDLIDLPFPQRKMSINPMGTLIKTSNSYKFERGVYSYPSVGDPIILPTNEQLQAIVENKDNKANVVVGYAPMASNAPVRINPDKLFGRHVAVLGNTGSGKSCSVAGLIRWSLEAAKESVENTGDDEEENLNARFIILDPNGEYSKAFDDFNTVRRYRVIVDDEEDDVFDKLIVPAWMWNSYEWSSIMQASGKAQRPLLQRSLREMRNGTRSLDDNKSVILDIWRHFSNCIITLKNDYKKTQYKDFPHNKNFAERLISFAEDADSFYNNSGELDQKILDQLCKIRDIFNDIARGKETGKYYKPFERDEVIKTIEVVNELIKLLDVPYTYEGPNEDSPVFFEVNKLPNYLEQLGREQNVVQYLDFLIMRIRTMLSDKRINSIINPEGSDEQLKFEEWLEKYVGNDKGKNGEIAIIDLSLVPTDVIHLIVAVISRIIFEALQRYRRLNNNPLPTVLVLEEAHNFIGNFNKENDENSPFLMCKQTFEKIAREGRKFGLGLMLSSQRPSELSSTVLSQCNTFLLHRIVNDRDQELVRRMIPDNLGALLNELPTLPTRKAILLGWATSVPTLVEMKELEDNERPESSDPDFWDVWTGIKARDINWQEISDHWINTKR